MTRFPLLLFFASALLAFVVADQSVLSSSVDYAKDDDTVRKYNDWSYKDCGTDDDIIELLGLSVSPDPPEPGKNLTVNAYGKVREGILPGAYADVTVKVGLIKLLHKVFDVCEEADRANATIHCPVDPGKYTVIHTIALPKEIPRAKFTVQIRGFTEDERPMICLDLIVNFMIKFPHLNFFAPGDV